MAQTNYTPISFYYSSTSGHIPSAGNLVAGEIAINTADGVIYYKNSGGSVVPLSFGSTGISWQSVQTANFTAVAGNGYPVNTTSAAITVLMPASPAAGDIITFTDYAGTFATNNLTIDPNGNKLLASTDAVAMATNHESLSFVYIDSTQGWLPYDGFNSSIPATALYLIQNSLRFRASAAAYLNRTPATTTNRTTWTWSAWIKRGVLGTYPALFQAVNGGVNNGTEILFLASGILQFYSYDATVNNLAYNTNAVYNDPAAWYHFVVAVDTTQATAGNRVKIYVNGVQVTSFSSTIVPAQNYNTWISTNNPHSIGENLTNSSDNFDGYMAEVNFVDGQQLTPSSFGKVDTTTGSWIPIQYTGTYGTNGFYLKFTDTSSVAALGTDFSGNGNTWTVNNVSLTADSTYDSMKDVPTLTSATVANYAVANPLNTKGNSTLTNGNLTEAISGNYPARGSTFAVTSGKFYVEASITGSGGGGGNLVAIMGIVSPSSSDYNIFNSGVGYYSVGGDKFINGTQSSYGTSWQTNGGSYVIGIALDATANTVQFYLNNVAQGVISIPASSDGWLFIWGWGSGSGGGTVNWNFGQQPYTYTPPTNYLPVNTYNL